ncbi:MAG: anion permease [Clostridiales bacterium]|nr:anion permease [Clostridiales bacterium]
MNTIAICIIIFVISLILYGINKLPMGIVGLSTILALVFTKCLDSSSALTYFSNSNVIMMASMFVVSAGLSRTSLVDNFSKAICKLTGGSFKRTYLCYLILAMILTNLMNSPGACFCVVFPLAAQMCKDYNVSPSKVMFPLGMVCVACCCVLPFGASIQETGIFQGFLDTYETGLTFQATDFTLGRAPMLIIAPLWAWTMGYKIAPEKPVIPIAMASVSTAEKEPLNKFSDLAGVVIFFAVIILFFIGNKLGIATWQACLLGAVLTVVCGTLTGKEAIAALPVDLACMLIGALAMAGALTATGAGDVIGSALANVVGNISNNYALGLIFFLVPFVLTQFMQNQAVINIFAPIVIMTCTAIGANPIGLLVIITAAGLTAYMTPMATSAIPIVMGAGGYDIKSLAKQSWMPSIVFGVFYVLYVMTVLPCF